MTQFQLEEKLHAGYKPGTVVMIQCVGSRNEEHPNCSRVCCTGAVNNALKVKEANPAADVYILYKDMRTYGFKEDYYRAAADKGVVFIRYDDAHKPEVIAQGGLKVRVLDPVLRENVVIEPDALVLSAGVLPAADNRKLAGMLKVPISKDGFFLEAHMKLRPLDFATEGVYLCGLAHGPKTIDECISQASGAASTGSDDTQPRRDRGRGRHRQRRRGRLQRLPDVRRRLRVQGDRDGEEGRQDPQPRHRRGLQGLRSLRGDVPKRGDHRRPLHRLARYLAR